MNADRELRLPWKQKKPRWSRTTVWEGYCPECGPFNQDDAKCPLDNESALFIRTITVQHPAQPSSFFLKAFQFSRMLGHQELRCSANCGFAGPAIHCPNCRRAVQSDNLRGIYLAPRLILYVPFVLVLSLGTVRATLGIGFFFWPYISSFFGWIYIFLFSSFIPWPFSYLFNKEVGFTFYETNEAPRL